MRTLGLFTVLLIWSSCNPLRAYAQADPKIVKAYESGFKTYDQFQSVYQFVLSSKEDKQWRQVPWIPGLWQGIQIASEKKKPMFIWAMNGDPLGCV
jgi:hypothetical protein